jgi:hypothetical protein
MICASLAASAGAFGGSVLGQQVWLAEVAEAAMSMRRAFDFIEAASATAKWEDGEVAARLGSALTALATIPDLSQGLADGAER